MLELLKQFPGTKQGIQDFIDSIFEEIVDHGEDSIQYATAIKSMADIVAAFNKQKDIQDCVVRDVENYGEKELNLQGVKYQVRETGVKYNFAGCGHSKWDELNQVIKDTTEQRKDIETTLKTIKASTPELVDAETGEMLRPPAKTSTTKVVITLPK